MLNVADTDTLITIITRFMNTAIERIAHAARATTLARGVER